MESAKEVKSSIVQTSFGNIYYLYSGIPSSPLFLIVHGSGTASSSKDYETLLFEYKIRFIEQFPLFFVAIDCPGYGKSTGLKSVIRGFPMKFLQEIIPKIANGQKSAFILMGHSQGGFSLINSVLANPLICDF